MSLRAISYWIFLYKITECQLNIESVQVNIKRILVHERFKFTFRGKEEVLDVERISCRYTIISRSCKDTLLNIL